MNASLGINKGSDKGTIFLSPQRISITVRCPLSLKKLLKAESC